MGRSFNPTARRGVRFSKPVLGAVISAVVALIIAALLHANAFAVTRFLDDSIRFAQTEAALVDAQLGLRTLSQAVLLAEDVALGVADEATAADALAEATRVVDDLEQRLAEFNLDAAVAAAAIDQSRAVTTALQTDQVATAGQTLSTDTLAAYETLRDTIAADRDVTVARLTNAQGFAQRLGTVAGFLVGLLAPTIAIFAYWRIARRQLSKAQVEMDSRLKAEKRVLQAKDEFIANISHELRTPLTSIYGFSEILVEQGLIDPAEAKTLIAVINEESAELNRMVEDLLTVARDEAGTIAYNFTEVDLAEEIATIVKAFNRTGGGLQISCSPTLVRADQLRTRQILRNLISNARRWGGDNVRVSVQQIGETAVLTVADDGAGVPPEIEDRLFTRYIHEGDNPLTAGSIGLGLSVVRILARGMAGDVWYERSGGWTRFVVELPLAEVATQPTPAASLPEERSFEVA